MPQVFLGDSALVPTAEGGSGAVVDRGGEAFYRIENYHVMPPFFMSVVSAYDHWMFVSSTGGLTCGRGSPDKALFPYITDDKIHHAHAHTGPVTCLLVDDGERTRLWQPFTLHAPVYRLTRNLYKNLEGSQLVFEEINHELGLTFSYTWTSGERLGFIRKGHLLNHSGGQRHIRLLDGLRNLLPAGVDQMLQAQRSTLLDAYKQVEVAPGLPAALYGMSSIVTDRAEPSEALRANLVWTTGLEEPGFLLTDEQLPAFCLGSRPTSELSSRGKRAAFLVFDELDLDDGVERDWYIVADVELGPAEVPARLDWLAGEMTIADIEKDINRGTRRLRELVGGSDGLQASADSLTAGRHFSNTLFNIMRGGVFDRAYSIALDDFIQFVEDWHMPLKDPVSKQLAGLGEHVTLDELSQQVSLCGDPDLERLVLEYLPLTFSRRHGDPSRPWNHFSIKVRNADGSNCLSYQGNWRDIFQNWEALAWSYPDFVKSFITKFVNASTADGFNAYRLTREGIDWEVLDPADPWSNIGYWGDHQVGYLYRLLDLSRRYHPGALESLLHREIFVYADVPYRLKSYEQMLRDPRNTVEYDYAHAERIAERVTKYGSDGKLVCGPDGKIVRVTLLEKLLVPALSKLGNLVPGGGIWLNTQRPEWNDANNALVGYGLSVVTLCYLRRYLRLLEGLLAASPAGDFSVTEEVAEVFAELLALLRDSGAQPGTDYSPAGRRDFMDEAGLLMARWRARVYAGFSGERRPLSQEDFGAFLAVAIEWVDDSIAHNRRDDGLFHAYNLMQPGPDGVVIDRLDVMLEGQAAVLYSGFLDPEESLSLLRQLRHSDLYREDQDSYVLYPDRQLPTFLEKNRIPEALIDANDFAKAELDSGQSAYLVRDVDGAAHFRARFRNAAMLAEALQADGGVDEPSARWLLDAYEHTFDHQRFTGRSGGMYKYEGLGCIYWHMVSKLVLAAAEVAMEADHDGTSADVFEGLAACYREAREGLGLHKSPSRYGAFPTDAYSHTPGFAGVQQPGLTGQVKEDVIARFTQLGVVVEKGETRFVPRLLEAEEFFTQPSEWHYITQGQARSMTLPAGTMGFTICGVPVIYRKGERQALGVVDSEGRLHEMEDHRLDAAWSRSLFSRDGRIAEIRVSIPESWLR